MKKLVKVHILPTEKDEQLRFSIYRHSGNGAISIGFLNSRSTKDIPQHLYFTSDEKIKKGNWYIDDCNQVREAVTSDKDYWAVREDYRKIVASTDKSVTANNDFICTDLVAINAGRIVPKIPQQFIEDYCKAGDTGDVYVYLECEAFCRRAEPFNYCPDCKGFQSETCEYGKNLLLDSNNCVVIHSTKESWSREEVNILMEKAYVKGYSDKNDGKDHRNEKLSDWIKENLK